MYRDLGTPYRGLSVGKALELVPHHGVDENEGVTTKSSRFISNDFSPPRNFSNTVPDNLSDSRVLLANHVAWWSTPK